MLDRQSPMDDPHDAQRPTGDDPPSIRVARLAWFELADAATRRALAMQMAAERTGGTGC
ncbi:hypothetical protein [Indioceanicola profundi]|uniref:hypothetical protein n=1 Tax=Indioceanicola profundi TaxID=2220096 RepID=UPI0013C51069|nr:hypothetical protein [Indioceanicola profundi]